MCEHRPVVISKEGLGTPNSAQNFPVRTTGFGVDVSGLISIAVCSKDPF